MFESARCSTVCSLATALGLAASVPGAGVAQDAGAAKRVFFDAGACRETKALSESDCEIAYANAKAEFDEKAPRFASRAECERYFRHCMIGDINGGGRRVTFMPQMRGFAIETGREWRVVPVAEGDGEGMFLPRPVDRADVSVSAAKTAAAQQAWKAMIASPAAATPSGEDANATTTVGPAQTYPLSPNMLEDLRNRERAFGAPHDP